MRETTASPYPAANKVAAIPAILRHVRRLVVSLELKPRSKLECPRPAGPERLVNSAARLAKRGGLRQIVAEPAQVRYVEHVEELSQHGESRSLRQLEDLADAKVLGKEVVAEPEIRRKDDLRNGLPSPWCGCSATRTSG